MSTQVEERRHQDGSADSLFYTPQATPSDEAPEEVKDSVDYKKRYDDLKRHYDSTVAMNKQQATENEAIARAAQNNAPVQMPEDLQQFASEYPDLYKQVTSVAKMQSEQGDKGLEAKLEALLESQAKVQQREDKLLLKQNHPDFEQIVADDNFHAWAKTQPTEIQKWIYENPDNPELASRAIDFYKLELGIKSKTSTKTRQTAADMVSTKTTSIDTKQKRIWKESEISKLSGREYEKYEEAIDLAVSEGRVLRGQ